MRGSEEAKEFMANLRAKRESKIKVETSSNSPTPIQEIKKSVKI